MPPEIGYIAYPMNIADHDGSGLPDLSASQESVAAWFESKGFDSAQMSTYTDSTGKVIGFRAPKKAPLVITDIAYARALLGVIFDGVRCAGSDKALELMENRRKAIYDFLGKLDAQ